MFSPPGNPEYSAAYKELGLAVVCPELVNELPTHLCLPVALAPHVPPEGDRLPVDDGLGMTVARWGKTSILVPEAPRYDLEVRLLRVGVVEETWPGCDGICTLLPFLKLVGVAHRDLELGGLKCPDDCE